MIPPSRAARKPARRMESSVRNEKSPPRASGDGPGAARRRTASVRDFDVEVQELPAEAGDLGQTLIVVVSELGHQARRRHREDTVLGRGRELSALDELAILIDAEGDVLA